MLLLLFADPVVAAAAAAAAVAAAVVAAAAAAVAAAANTHRTPPTVAAAAAVATVENSDALNAEPESSSAFSSHRSRQTHTPANLPQPEHVVSLTPPLIAKSVSGPPDY